MADLSFCPVRGVMPAVRPACGAYSIGA
jgi:hypothetical protein